MTDAQYKNLQIFAEKWRGYKRTAEPMSTEVFQKTIQMNKTVVLEYVSQVGRRVIIFLIAKGHNISNAQSIRQLLGRLHMPAHIILVTEQPLNNFGKKALLAYKHLYIERLLHENFSLVVPKGPLCHAHRILSRDEINTLLNEELYCKLINLPKILQSDVQCVWLGARIGDVIEIEMVNDINGRALHYRVVVQKSGRIAIPAAAATVTTPNSEEPTEADDDGAYADQDLSEEEHEQEPEQENEAEADE